MDLYSGGGAIVWTGAILWGGVVTVNEGGATECFKKVELEKYLGGRS